METSYSKGLGWMGSSWNTHLQNILIKQNITWCQQWSSCVLYSLVSGKKSFRLHDSNVYHNKKKVALEIVILNICSNKSNEPNHCKFKRKQEFISFFSSFLICFVFNFVFSRYFVSLRFSGHYGIPYVKQLSMTSKICLPLPTKCWD